MMRKHKPIYANLLLALLLWGCEKDVTLDLPEPEDQIVVEGHIEQGEVPYVFLTRNVAFFGPTDVTSMENQFVHNADVKVSDGSTMVTLAEFCLSSLPDSLQQVVAGYLGIDWDSTFTFNICVYSTFPGAMTGQTGKTYTLDVRAEGRTLSASTSIPKPTPLDSMWYKAHPDPDKDSLVVLWCAYDDPDTLGNFLRYFTSRNGEPFYPGRFGSVIDDQFFNGEKLDFTLDRGEPKDTELDLDTYGYFNRGDTITVKWCAIDRAQYEFWRTAEQEFGNSGNPFGTPTIISTNIEGGLGIWGGYGVAYHTLIVPQ